MPGLGYFSMRERPMCRWQVGQRQGIDAIVSLWCLHVQQIAEPYEETMQADCYRAATAPRLSDKPRISSSPHVIRDLPSQGKAVVVSSDDSIQYLRKCMSEIGLPGQFPYTRGIQPTMYRGRLWTMR